MSEIITLAESKRLIELESIIGKGLQTFIEVGAALAEVRDSKLYRVEFSTFEEYCREKWKMTDRHARNLIGSSSAARAIERTGTTVPKSERQARPLAKLSDPNQQAEAWTLAVATSGGDPTGDDVAEAVHKVRGGIGTKARGMIVEKDSMKLWTAKRYARPLSKKDKALLIAWLSMELEPEKPNDTTETRHTSFSPSNGSQYADLAISNLRKIQPNDLQRGPAFLKVVDFIERGLEGGGK